MKDAKRLQKLFKTRPEFVDYMSERVRDSKIRDLDRRISALQRTKECLENSATTRLTNCEQKNIHTLICEYGWSEEDIIWFQEDFAAQNPRKQEVKKRIAPIVDVASKLLGAFSI